ncbi:lysophospholipid acyltransferase family protein [Nitrosophilus kaiyonis]|uniref:lysophospholipid acyltransferase family protein n=1 Tax=Nitrosophilus kaiyonis TaxID=2930200 RepID=UPI002492B9B5|nr:lysophospholipid acyltransferase family protein [Nitrosophilus kaiyonis]
MKKETKRKILSFILPPIGAFLIRAIYLTCKKEYKLPKNIPNEPFIVAFWHGNLLMQPYLYKKIRKNHKIAVMISEHFDGEIIAKTIKSFGFESIRGSTKKGAAKVLLQAIRKLKDGYDIAITPDGPRGPIFSIADGIVAISQKQDVYIIPFYYKASKFWQLKSWDRFIIPKPFSKLTFIAKEPFKVTDMDKESAKNFIKTQMIQY